jgi:hypothetical protein
VEHGRSPLRQHQKQQARKGKRLRAGSKSNMAKKGTIAPLAKQALANGVSVDDLVAAHPELDEKALRRGYAQVKSKAGKAKPAGKKKAAKKASKKAGKRAPAAAQSDAPQSARRVFRSDGTTELLPPVASKPGADPEVRRFILQHGTKAVKAALAELDS